MLALRLLLPASGSVTLEPRDGLADQPLAFVQVFARSLRDGRVVVDRGFALHDGRLQLHDLPAEGLDVALFAPGLRWTGTMVIPPGTMREHGVVLLHRGARVTGRAGPPRRRRTYRPLRPRLAEPWRRPRRRA